MRSAIPNRRVRVYDAEDLAVEMRETFVDRPVKARTEFSWGWPTVMQNVGDSLGIAYGSDKWKPKDRSGKREIEIYKHIAESRNRIFCVPGTIRPEDEPSQRMRVIGPRVDFADVPMPQHFAVLAFFKEVNVQLYTEGTDVDPRFGPDPDDGVMTLTVRHGMLAGSMIRWSEVDDRDDQPFLFVYTSQDGVLFVVVGEELEVLKDGIVG